MATKKLLLNKNKYTKNSFSKKGDNIIGSNSEIILKHIKDSKKLDYTKILKEFCFGQKAEDFIVNLIFRNNKGTFIDVGANDGIKYSNSFAFSKLGWKGICIEAHPDYYKICCENRDNEFTKILNVACGKEDSSNVTFYANFRGSLSTLNPNLDSFYKENYKEFYHDINYNGKIKNFLNGKIEVEGKKLDTIINENIEFLENKIDLLSIDVDGSEEYLLKGFNILEHKPRVVIFEVSVLRNVIENYMKDKKYYKLYDNKLNAIYCRDKEDYLLFNKSIKNLKNNIIIYKPPHPIDD